MIKHGTPTVWIIWVFMGCAGSTAVDQGTTGGNRSPSDVPPVSPADGGASVAEVRSRRASAENELEAMEDDIDFALSSEEEEGDRENGSQSGSPRARVKSTRSKNRDERESFENLPEVPDAISGAIDEQAAKPEPQTDTISSSS